MRVAPLSFAGGARAEYRLGEGPWTETGPEARIVLPGLGAGAYALAVRAVNAEGTPSAVPAVRAWGSRAVCRAV